MKPRYFTSFIACIFCALFWQNQTIAAQSLQSKAHSSDPVIHDNIWPHIRQGFQIDVDLQQSSLQTELKWFTKHSSHLHRVIERSKPFLYFILSEAEKADLPTELVLLPFVESAFRPFAYSHGRAAGIWQFIPATGRNYGLKQDWWYDGRRDIYASTRAALKYLKRLHKRFDGDWLLALAAYNSGSGSVRKAMRKNKRSNKPTDFWHLDLPKETRAYVPKLLAIQEVIKHPEQYGHNLQDIAYKQNLIELDVGSQIDLAVAAEMAGIPLKTLHSYNPGYNRWATSPDGPHTLVMPLEISDHFNTQLKKLPENKRMSWKRHQIKDGETLSEIAAHYSTTLDHLRKLNHIKGTNIRAGKYLLIPVASRNLDDYALSLDKRLQSIQNRSKNKHSIKHTVQPGESFWTIARKYKISMHKLADWNGMAIKDPLRAGQKLAINTTTPQDSNNLPVRTQTSISYTVKSGDSLSRIASRYKVSVKDLHRWNQIKGKYLKPGQRIKVYIDVTEQSVKQG